MTVKGGTSQACAACKYQRRKCSSDCPLAQYFPPDQPKLFQNAHKLFGVSNILKILKNLDPGQKGEAMRTIIFQANMRDKFPVHGAYFFIHNLQIQVQQAEQELEFVNAQLAMLRHHHHHLHHHQNIKLEQVQHHQYYAAEHHGQTYHMNMMNIGSAPSSPSHPSSQLQLRTAAPSPSAPNVNNVNVAPLSLFQYQQQDYSSSSFNIATTASAGVLHHQYDQFPAGCINNSRPASSNCVGGLWVQQPHTPGGHIYDDENNTNGVPLHQYTQHEASGELDQTYNQVSPFFDTVEDRQSYIDAYDSSSESSLKDTIQSAELEHVGENELKSAAACFTLTSVN